MSTEFFQGSAENGSDQKSRITDWTWNGAKVVEHTGKVADLYSRIPVFSRQPFRVGQEENRFKDEIRREPLTISESPIPIATVSKDYALIQHREVLASVFRALKLIKIDISELPSTLLLSEYGERMQWSCNLPHFDFDPGDRCPIVLRINCLNSVDTTTLFDISFGWYRLVCSNGMMFGLKESRFRKRHVQSLDPGGIAAYLEEELKDVPEQESLYKRWLGHSVEGIDLESWIDEHVADAWGPHAAARTWTILKDGFDGEVEQAKDRKPHELSVKHSTHVPGACAPVGNLFHVSQALSWIAGTRNTIPERLEYVKAIPRLMEPLTADVA
ncbi:MAG: DUF945 domain-containing protein [Bryobacterales bacterium]|nr:DUF945 domain-containing protein [Bryobacterales bacterium]